MGTANASGPTLTEEQHEAEAKSFPHTTFRLAIRIHSRRDPGSMADRGVSVETVHMIRHPSCTMPVPKGIRDVAMSGDTHSEDFKRRPLFGEAEDQR